MQVVLSRSAAICSSCHAHERTHGKDQLPSTCLSMNSSSPGARASKDISGYTVGRKPAASSASHIATCRVEGVASRNTAQNVSAGSEAKQSRAVCSTIESQQSPAVNVCGSLRSRIAPLPRPPGCPGCPLTAAGCRRGPAGPLHRKSRCPRSHHMRSTRHRPQTLAPAGHSEPDQHCNGAGRSSGKRGHGRNLRFIK